MRLILGMAIVMVGVVITFQAGRLSALNSQWAVIRRRHPFLRRITAAQRFFEGERTAQVLVVFWRVCGVLWIIGGVATILGYSSRVP